MKIKLCSYHEMLSHKPKYQLPTTRWRESFSKYAGKWVNVEEEYLFTNQYNVVEGNMRILDEDVAEIQDDIRLGKMRCNYCGKTNELSSACPSCGNKDFLIRFERHIKDKTEQVAVYNHQHVVTLLPESMFLHYGIIIDTLPNWILLEVKMQYETHNPILGEFCYVVIRQGDYSLTQNSNFEEPFLTWSDGAMYSQYEDAVGYFKSLRRKHESKIRLDF